MLNDENNSDSNQSNLSKSTIPSPFDRVFSLFLSVFPYSTISILGILIAFKYELVLEMVDYLAKEFDSSRTMVVVAIILIIFGGMSIMVCLYIGIDYIRTRWRLQREKQERMNREREILLILFNSLNGKHWKDKTRWCSSDPIQTWKGVKVDPVTKRVNKLILADNNLGGTIPEEIGELSGLIEIDLRINQIKGPIPDSTCKLRRLEGLYLYDNYLEGKIPLNICKLPNLSGVYLFSNNLSGIEEAKQLFRENLKPDCHLFI